MALPNKFLVSSPFWRSTKLRTLRYKIQGCMLNSLNSVSRISIFLKIIVDNDKTQRASGDGFKLSNPCAQVVHRCSLREEALTPPTPCPRIMMDWRVFLLWLSIAILNSWNYCSFRFFCMATSPRHQSVLFLFDSDPHWFPVIQWLTFFPPWGTTWPEYICNSGKKVEICSSAIISGLDNPC